MNDRLSFYYSRIFIHLSSFISCICVCYNILQVVASYHVLDMTKNSVAMVLFFFFTKFFVSKMFSVCHQAGVKCLTVTERMFQ